MQQHRGREHKTYEDYTDRTSKDEPEAIVLTVSSTLSMFDTFRRRVEREALNAREAGILSRSQLYGMLLKQRAAPHGSDVPMNDTRRHLPRP